ncbi:MAG TPA: alpha/beta fold hydrolase [Vicinamibacterales bacterium]|nr:alpha/beta fold hydrolase [Vicinamibacterales bacterium]
MRRSRLFFALAAAAVAAVGISVEARDQRVSFRTSDGVTIAATWYEPSVRPAPAVILVHMLGRSRRDWDSLASRLADSGIGALALDLRGHGESSGTAPGEDHSAMVRDIEAARRHLATRSDVQHSRIGLAGASLGANLAALEAAADANVASLALLSASLDYRGLRIEAAVRKYGSRPILLVVSDEDGYARRTAEDLKKAGGGIREVLTLSAAGHGTNMLGRSPDLAPALVAWFQRTLQ